MKQLYKFIIVIISVFITFLLFDFYIGYFLNSMLSKLNKSSYEIGRTQYSLYDVNSPVVIVGSSRAAHHYIPQIISDSLGCDVYNIGRDGCFFLYNNAVINELIARYTPRVIIWECSVNSLNFSDDDKISNLYPYYNRLSYVTSVTNNYSDVKERLKLKINSYRYNSSAIKILVRYFLPSSYGKDLLNGYLPLVPSKLKTELILNKQAVDNSEINYKNKELFNKTVQAIKSQGIQLIIFDSPFYKTIPDSLDNNHSYDVMKDICNEYNIPLFDNRQLAEFLAHPEYFKDVMHLNDNGAKVYTEIVLKQIKSVIE